MRRFNNLNKKKAKAENYRKVVGRYLQIFLALVFLLFVGRFLYLGISQKVAGQNLSQRTKELYSRNQILKAYRGTIYDRNGLTIAEDSHKYTVYAILDKSSVDYKNRPMYVVDKDKTATQLAQVLPISKEKILAYLNPKHRVYQVEFGNAGSGLSKKQKRQIAQMKLPGIEFIETPSRLYPNGPFASHIIGLAQLQTDKTNGQQKLVGTMGLEKYFNKYLTGEDGFSEAMVDTNNNQLPNSPHFFRAPKDGDSLYLTLDSQLQTTLESLLNQVNQKYKPVSLKAVVEDVRTGKILAASQRPTFNPETKKGLNSNWRDGLVQDTYEPGSVFKILSLTAAIQSGHYNPNALYKSGAITLDGSTIHDWNISGWGMIPFSQAFPRSSNVGMATLERLMGNKTWGEYLRKFHIGQKTNVTLPGENPGLFKLNNALDGGVSSFGQGVEVNAMQIMQVYSALANSGQMIKPQFVEKIVSPEGKVIKRFHREKVGAPVFDQKTAATALKLMQDVVNQIYGTGQAYRVPGHNIDVKTGTAQIAGPGGYLTGANNYLFSVMGMTPADHPHYAVYLTMKQPQKMTAPAELILNTIFQPITLRLINQDAINQAS